MPRRIVEHGGRTYTISPDDNVPLSERMWAIVSARLVDEITGEAPRSPVTVEVDKPGFIPRVADDGLVGLVGIPGRVFPNLDRQSYTITLTVKAEGYIPHREKITITSTEDFPITFVPRHVGNLFLHREPVVIKGRTVLANGSSTTPISDVVVSFTDIWRTFPPAIIERPPESSKIVSLFPPLYFARDAGTALMKRREMKEVRGENKYLLEQIHKGSQVLKLSNRLNLESGDIIMIDGSNPDLKEYLTTDTVSEENTVDHPTRVTLVGAAAFSHQKDAVVQKVIPLAQGDDNPFAQDAIAGDTCVFLDSIIDLDEESVVEISNDDNPADSDNNLAEYHTLHRFSATSDVDGYFRLPPLSRVAQCNVQADIYDTQHKTIKQEFGPNYGHRENRLDFMFR